MIGQVRTSPGAAYNLGYHVVWCPKYRRPLLSSQLPTLWSRSYFVATVGAVSAETVQRSIETQDGPAPKGSGRA
ncbi:transposase IS200 family protein [Nonomuraea fuscirosea]|uniref:Transposase IS200 family protein n=1 Tax=Nonomuraea fuscirosea TaxID=1291556 RepID=A0A2T0N3L2_9ACTN|nr:transposase IS200 family protein [Nonomuraea fuscirosea]